MDSEDGGTKPDAPEPAVEQMIETLTISPPPVLSTDTSPFSPLVPPHPQPKPHEVPRPFMGHAVVPSKPASPPKGPKKHSARPVSLPPPTRQGPKKKADPTDVNGLADSMTSLSLIPASIRFGRGGKSNGFASTHHVGNGKAPGGPRGSKAAGGKGRGKRISSAEVVQTVETPMEVL